MKIPIAKPLFDENEMRAVLEPIKSGWVSQGPKAEEFESKFSAYVGTRYASSVGSGTAALHLALIACGIQPGDEVITSSFTCVATVNPIEYVGAKPVLVDIDLDTFSLDPNKVEEVITGRTKAIIPVHLFGLSTDMDPIIQIAHKYRLKVIEDAALGLGAFYKGKHVGVFGNAAAFSFHPRKMITTGEGGIVVTNDEKIDKEVKVLRNYGASIPAWKRHHKGIHVLPTYDVLGFNYKMSDVHASLGIAQMAKLPDMLQRRREIAERYNKELKSLDWLINPNKPSGYIHSYQSYVCLCNPDDIIHKGKIVSIKHASKKRDELMGYLARKGIATVAGAQAIHNASYYKQKYGFDESDFPNALIAELLSIALPIYTQLTGEEQEYIIENIKAFDV
jgi:perosamine synthetase